jgi:hypothetical protein
MLGTFPVFLFCGCVTIEERTDVIPTNIIPMLINPKIGAVRCVKLPVMPNPAAIITIKAHRAVYCLRFIIVSSLYR